MDESSVRRSERNRRHPELTTLKAHLVHRKILSLFYVRWSNATGKTIKLWLSEWRKKLSISIIMKAKKMTGKIRVRCKKELEKH